MKRILFVLLLMGTFIFIETAMAQCPFYGVGVVRGRVRMFGSYGGQENAFVQITGPSAHYFIPDRTYTDATGFYRLRARRLPACESHTGTVNAYYFMINGGGAPNELWAASAPVYLRRPNQGEIIRVTRPLRLRFWRAW